MASFVLFFTACFLLVTVILATDDSPGFFLKITKNVPRLGRRSDKQFENYFFKNSKQIPRIGRRNEVEDSTAENTELNKWMDDFATRSKRFLVNSILTAGRSEYSVVQPVNANTLIDLIEKGAIPSDNIKFVHWKDFDRALQTDSELYSKIFTLGRKPDRQLKDDLNLSRFMPFFEKTNNENDLVFYRGDKEMYPPHEKDLLHYNNI